MGRALLLAVDEGFNRFIISSDCLAVVQRVSGNLEDRSLCGPVIQNIRTIASSFESCFFRHDHRELNTAVHGLAKFSEAVSCSVWRGVTPDCIREAICNDIMIM
uniref:Uncharacterized protein n=1 Tax=Avena sativa TaxID=4498 RepID=A0ACD5X148_AVESA